MSVDVAGVLGPDRAKVGARLRLTLSYALFLLLAGAGILLGVYLVLRYVPDFPLTSANPGESVLVSPSQTDVPSREEILGHLVTTSGYIFLALALIGFVGGWFLAGWILRPLQRINHAARVASTGDLSQRIKLAGRNDEFRQLADSFDHMLDRLQDAFQTHERFAANASHELRTPLAVTSTLLDVAERDPDGQDYPVLLERLRITNDRAIGLTESLLRLADANAITAIARPTDLAAVVREVVGENGREAREHDVEVLTRLAAAPVSGDVALLSQLVANLVQNAIRHNQSPGTAVITTTHDRGLGTVTLRVGSGGARFSDDAVATLAEPFLRGAGRVRGVSRQRGNGLGLTLVSRITAVHGGSLHIAARVEGGLDITVTLPSS